MTTEAQPETRDFPLADILTVTTGRLLSRDHMAGVYRILNWMTGDDLFTHQLSRAVTAAKPVVLAQHPQLAEVVPPTDIDAPDLLTWLVDAEARFGESLPVMPMSQWEHRDAIEELCDMVGPEKAIVVEMPDD